MQIEEILLLYGAKKRTGSALTTIDTVEATINFRLPYDYRYFLENYEAFENFVGPEYVVLEDIDSILRRNIDYEITSILPNTLMIGGDGGGEFIAIEFIDRDRYRIVLSPFIGLEAINHIEIGTSFTDMFVRLNSGEEWFK